MPHSQFGDTDHSSREGAMALARRIEAYWQHQAACRIEPVAVARYTLPVWRIVSDLGPDALPQGGADGAAQ